jgi:uncharacterized protein YceK
MKNLNLAAIALLLLATGCGSISSRWRGASGTYSGVRFDCEQVTHYSTESEVIAVFDIPLSAVVDTLCLPYDLSARENVEPAGPNAVEPGTGRLGYKK